MQAGKGAKRGEKWIPEDTFGARLALIRQRNGWNHVQAAAACDINDETWRKWEKTGRSPQDLYNVVRKISDATGCDYDWLLRGGDLVRSRCDDVLDFRVIPGGARAATREVEGQLRLPTLVLIEA